MRGGIHRDGIRWNGGITTSLTGTRNDATMKIAMRLSPISIHFFIVPPFHRAHRTYKDSMLNVHDER